MIHGVIIMSMASLILIFFNDKKYKDHVNLQFIELRKSQMYFSLKVLWRRDMSGNERVYRSDMDWMKK